MRNLLKNPFATFSLAALVVVILVAGLRPFDFAPKNRVTHTVGQDGLRFSRPGIAYGAGEMRFGEGALTIEILFKSGRGHSHGIARILSVSDADGNEIFFIGVWRSSIIVRKGYAGDSGRGRELGVKDAARAGETHLLAVTTSKDGTSIFLDGKIAREAPNFSILREGAPLMGRLVLGNSPDGSNQWYGEILGVGIFNRRMDPADAGDRYRAWMGAGESRKDIADLADGSASFFAFQGSSGRLAANLAGGPDLVIPATFRPLKRKILEVPGKGYRLDRSQVKDIMLNVVGFVPFGFLLCLFLAGDGGATIRTRLTVVLLGGGLSLFIELSQAFLPTRSSSVLDLVFNTLGTVIGAMLF